MDGPGVTIARKVGRIVTARPAVPFAVMMIIGVLLHDVLPPRPVVWLAVMAGAIGGAVAWFRRGGVSAAFLLLAMVSAGVLAGQRSASFFPRDHVAHFTTCDGRLAQLELRIDEEPRTIMPALAARPLPPKQIAAATVRRILTTAGWQPAAGQVVLHVESPHPRLALGQVVRAIGVLHRPAPAMNPGQFDWEEYYRKKRMLAMLSVPHVSGIAILGTDGPGPLEALRLHARRLLAAGFGADRSAEHALLRAVVLGDRDPEMRDAQDHFRQSGTSYLLAVSGLHVIVVAGFVLLLCRLLRLRPRAATVASIALVGAYALVTLPATPVLRATLLCLGYGTAMLLRRSADGVQLLALSCVVVLLCDPLDVYSGGFQLSFGVVLCLLLFARRATALVRSLEDPDLKVARSFRPPRGLAAAWYHAKWRGAEMLAVTVLAWLVSAPLICAHFDQLNPYAVPSGLVMFPLVAAGLCGGVAKAALTLLLPGFAGTWAALATLPMLAIRHVAGAMARLPGADVAMAPPPAWAIAGYYVMLFIILLQWTNPVVRWLLRCGAAAGAAMALLLPMLLGGTSLDGGGSAGETRVTLLAVGAGQVGVVELPTGELYLIDDGSSSIASPLRTCLEPYLRRLGRRRVTAIFLSHPDLDHINAAAETAEIYGPREVCVNGVFRRQCAGNPPAEDLLRRLDAAGCPLRVLSRGQEVALGPDARLGVAWPPEGRAFASTNNACLVLKLTSHGRSVLFTGDIQVPTQRELIQLAAGSELHADVLVAPHHGSAEASTAEFLRAVEPEAIVSSNDRRLSHKQHEFDRLAAGTALYRTHDRGAITVAISRRGELSVRTFLPRKARQQD